jgi:hypothetical protein
MSINT